jgi:hypothetical protein
MARWNFAIKFSKKMPCNKREKNKEFLEVPISVKYQKELYKLISKYLKKFHSKLVDNTELEYWLYEFQNYMDTPTKIVEKNRFEGITHRENIKSWLCQCCKYFLFNRKKIDIYSKIFDTEDCNTYSESEEWEQDGLKLKMLYYLFSSLNDRDIYIMCSYLYCIEKGITIVHLDEKITNVLIEHSWFDMTAEHVRKIKNKSLVKAKKKAKIEKKDVIFGDIFVLLIEATEKNNEKIKIVKEYGGVDDEKNLSYEDILIKKREAVMLNLGIERDFITYIINNKKNEN